MFSPRVDRHDEMLSLIIIMPANSAKDRFHDAVRKGEEKEGWIITDDPLRIEVGDV